MKTHLSKVFAGILAAIYLATMALSGVAFATPQQVSTLQIPSGQQETKRGVNPETGRVSFIGGGTPIHVPDLAPSKGLALESRAAGMVDIYGMEFGLQNPSQELKLLRSEKDANGNDIVRYQQVYNGVPILAGEMIVNINPQGDLLSISGEVSSDLTVSTDPAIMAQEAEQAALSEIAKIHQLNAGQLAASDPELWIFDESLLTASTRPVELVWRLDVTAKDAFLPIWEMVLVNAQTGTMSFHVNQMHTGTVSVSVPSGGISSSVGPATLDCPITTGTASPSLFQPYIHYACGLTAHGVATGDFNNDGRQDVALSVRPPGSFAHSLLLFLQDASGILSQPVIYAAGIRSEYITAGDLNNDGRVDLAAADISDHTVSVFFQRTDGTFDNRVTYPTSTFPVSVAIGDINSDGRNDLVVTHGYSEVLGVFTQTLSGTLNSMVTYPSISAGGVDLIIADVNSDGRNDVVRTSGQGMGTTFMVYLQNNAQTLDPYTEYTLPDCGGSICTGIGIEIGDVTGDGRPDLVTNDSTNGITPYMVVYPQGTNGVLQAPVSYPALRIAGPVELTDINLDNRLDVITLNAGYSTAAVFLQGSSGELELPTFYPLTYKDPYYPQDLDVSDVNNDGLPDLLIADGYGLTVLYRNTIIPPTETLTPSLTPTVPTPTLTPSPIVTQGPGPTRTPGPTSTAGPSPTAVPPSSTGSRRTYTASNDIVLPGTFLCDQIQAICTNGLDPDADRAHRYAADTFVFYNTHHKRNSFDNQGGTIVSSVHYGLGYYNAGWNGSQMTYGDGMVSDDIVGHELTHAVTEHSSNLIYSYQSGAINESFSDIWGEFIDLTNGLGNDTAEVKWFLGEDSTLGRIRLMSDPTYYGHPDKMSSLYYYHGPDDNGGIHINSGVNNKAAYLMVEGGSFNGRTITGIGLNKTAAVYYEVQANLLTSGANYNNLYYALLQACQNLIGGVDGINQTDCNQVETAAEAVEMVPTTLPPTSTPTSTPTFGPLGGPLYLSLTGSQTVAGVAAADEDILRFDGTSWSLFFDGSDVGVGSPDLSAFSFLDADTILMSFSTNVTVNGIAATPQDVLRFDVTSFGSTTTGSFSLYFDGSDVGLDNATSEKIDALSLLMPGERLLISTTGNPSVPNLTTGKDEDALMFAPSSYGDITSGHWSLYFDGSDVGLGETSGEDVDALHVVNENIYLSTLDTFSVPGVSGADEDVFVCAPTSTGDVTACNYSPNLFFDGSTWGLSANDVDAFNFLDAGAVLTLVPSNTPTTVPGATNTPTRTTTPSPTATRTSTVTATSVGGNTFTFMPVADAYVNAGSAATNYGTATTLRADASPNVHSYLRFNIQGVSGTVTQATLRVFANSASAQGCIANRVSDNTWSENTLNYNNAPPVGNTLGSSGAFSVGAWINIDVTAYITGNGTYNLALTTPSSTAISFASRETANAPQLIVETSP